MYVHLRDEARWALPEVLEWQAGERGGQRFVAMVDGGGLTYAEAAADAARVAAWFAAQGVRPGDPVAVMLPNGLDFVRVWLGLGRLGAVMVALNTDLRGALLEHQLANCEARLAVTTAAAAPRFDAAAARLPLPGALVVTDGAAAPAGERPRIPFDGWRDMEPWGGPLPKAGDTACVMYTSGTTGPSKGVVMPHAHTFLFGLGSIDHYAMTPDDVFYVVLPMFHANALYMQLGATLIAGASAVLRKRFSASAWLDDVRRTGATVTNSLGAVTAFVAAQPPRPEDRDHRLRVIGCAPNPAALEAVLRERFAIPDVIGLYGMTEVNIPLYGERGIPRPGTCGRVYERYFAVEIHDPDTDLPLPPGRVGEIVVRPKAARGFMTGYHRMPDKTVEAWQNLWFRTGDAGVMAPDGTVTFVDRIKDCIRRRGENVSSYEIETVIAGMAGVEEVAAFAVPSGLADGEDEIMVVVVPVPGATVEPAAVVEFARRELPRYAVPRYVEVMDALPKTHTAKVRKTDLRNRGVTPATLDSRHIAPSPDTAGGCGC
ncbi:AMP-binding protein [Azospirillum halopraeferens]|uniref:AMP-binding protein n=1 Tax=Azospirillum halopraeferens TaxID=34010 RepID=UPI0003FF442D|nr:AMP-binding protein [Azospirillum halopraeferens]